MSSLKLTNSNQADEVMYKLEGSRNNSTLAVIQLNSRKDLIIAGRLSGKFMKKGVPYKRDPFSSLQQSIELRECLNSSKPYFKPRSDHP